MAESERDAEFMVAIAALTIGAHQPSLTSDEAQALAGKILCLIFDYAKPHAYVEGMTQARGRYAGIAGSSALRAKFTGAVEHMASLGWLDSLAAAIANDAWSAL
jgi:hypothetical protein